MIKINVVKVEGRSIVVSAFDMTHNEDAATVFLSIGNDLEINDWSDDEMTITSTHLNADDISRAIEQQSDEILNDASELFSDNHTHTIEFKEDSGEISRLNGYDSLYQAAFAVFMEHDASDDVAVVCGKDNAGKKVWAVNTKNHGTTVKFSECFDDVNEWWSDDFGIYNAYAE